MLKTIRVQKFGGSSLASCERIKQVVKRVASAQQQGVSPVLVVSAMGQETDRLLSLAGSISNHVPPRELDALLATGEQASAACLAMALMQAGVSAQSLTGWQCPITTTSAYQAAEIQAIDIGRIHQLIEAGIVPVVTGYQGISTHGDVTTLGRGGSDLTAVALAAALGACDCEIYTDVRGVYTADPSMVPSAQLLPRLSYEQMLHLSSLGAKVLQKQAVVYAKRYGVPVHIRSSFSLEEGTLVDGSGCHDPHRVAGMACEKHAKITISGLDTSRLSEEEVFSYFGEQGVAADLLMQGHGEQGFNITFSVDADHHQQAVQLARRLYEQGGGKQMIQNEEVVKISLMGSSLMSPLTLTNKLIAVMQQSDVPIYLVRTADEQITVLVAAKQGLSQAACQLHDWLLQQNISQATESVAS